MAPQRKEFIDISCNKLIIRISFWVLSMNKQECLQLHHVSSKMRLLGLAFWCAFRQPHMLSVIVRYRVWLLNCSVFLWLQRVGCCNSGNFLSCLENPMEYESQLSLFYRQLIFSFDWWAKVISRHSLEGDHIKIWLYITIYERVV